MGQQMAQMSCTSGGLRLLSGAGVSSDGKPEEFHDAHDPTMEAELFYDCQEPDPVPSACEALNKRAGRSRRRERASPLGPSRAAGPPLSEAESKALAQLQELLEASPEPEVAPNTKECYRTRLLRFLKATRWDPVATHQRMINFAEWWRENSMDELGPEAELDETGPLFLCGSDLEGRPTLIARPCVHHSSSPQHSVEVARRCLHTVQRCVERYPPGVDSHTVIYDARGLDPIKNLDLVFMKVLVPALGGHFPGRLHSVVVINGHWTMTGFWSAVCLLLDPVTKAKIVLLGRDFEAQLLSKLGPDHPYLQYAAKVRDLSAKEAALQPLPKSTPYEARWRESLEFDEGDGSDDDFSASEPDMSETTCSASQQTQSSGSGSEPATPGSSSGGSPWFRQSTWPLAWQVPAPAAKRELDPPSDKWRRQVSL